MEFNVIECPEYSRGILTCSRNLRFALRYKNGINHVTGDVHYLMLGLPPDSSVLTIHDCVFMDNTSFLRRRILKTIWLDLPVRRAKYITAVSEATKLHVMQLTGCASTKIEVINTTVKDHFVPISKEFNLQRPVILQIGTAPNKNWLRIIESLRGISCHLLIVGEIGEAYRSALNSSGTEFSNRSNLSDSEMLQCYAESDMLLFPSLREGFGMPIVEANMVGRPVVTSNISSMPEVAGDAACLVDPYSTASIRRGVERVIESEGYRRQLVMAGFKNSKRFSPATVAMQYKCLYERIAAAKGARLS